VNYSRLVAVTSLILWTLSPAWATSPDKATQESQKSMMKELAEVSKAVKQMTEILIKVDPAALKADIRKYETALTPPEKYRLALSLAFREKQIELAPTDNKAIVLMPNERKILNEASHDADRTLAKVQELEKKLTPSDINNITSDNPNSFYREIGRFERHSPPACDFKAYTQMRKKVPFQALFKGGFESSIYIQASEGLYFRSYDQKINQLLKADSRFVSYRALADTFYDVPTPDTSPITGRSMEEVKAAEQKQIDRITKEWGANGIPVDQVRKAAFSFGQQSSECLSRFDPRFFDEYKMELTLIRGHHLLRKIRDYYLQKKSMPDDLRNLAVHSSTDPLFQSDEDGWYGTYVAELVHDKVRLLAYGPEKSAKEPPILIGELPLTK